MNELLDKLEREGLKIASFKKRVLAYLIDSLILSFIVFIILFDKLSNLSDFTEIILVIQDFALGFIILQFIYHFLFTLLYGASPGKMLCKIAIIDEKSLDKPNAMQSALRAAIRQLSDTAFMLGFAWALGNELRRTWEDLLAKTLVIELA
ncbi:RDD family protein [Campylobacter troglodytis]|uniref:RDD family protein n=1 Tax=Campylobacter troglodytis TaxID=654363 RepID=UPI001157F725|nr:RDD family protein [Campylobacter troglodytis]TQR56921.1 RDD family protein [Campylobacter troglodytis]